MICQFFNIYECQEIVIMTFCFRLSLFFYSFFIINIIIIIIIIN